RDVLPDAALEVPAAADALLLAAAARRDRGVELIAGGEQIALPGAVGPAVADRPHHVPVLLAGVDEYVEADADRTQADVDVVGEGDRVAGAVRAAGEAEALVARPPRDAVDDPVP